MVTGERKKWVDDTWEKIESKMDVISKRTLSKIPYTTKDGRHNDLTEENIFWWTNGFWPGMMWLMYIGTKKEHYKEIAVEVEVKLDKALHGYDELIHDIGFMWLPTSVANYRLFNSEESRRRGLIAANLLAGRFNPKGNFIRAWNNERDTGWAIIDCMMNIPLLYWASQEINDPRYTHVANAHADMALETFIRDDGSVNHIATFDPQTGEFIETIGGQGYGVGSSWSRGQSWAIYGFALSYLHTKKQEYLDAAKKVAHYFIANICDDYIPKVDFRSPAEPVKIDTTAGAVAACGLIEISKVVPEYERELYLNSAIKILKALGEKYCDFTTEEDGLLLNGTGAYHDPNEEHANMNIIYGDYYYIEAILKLKGNDILFW